MKSIKMTPEEKKARKAEYDRAYRARKKSGIVARPEVEEIEEVKEAEEELPTSRSETPESPEGVAKKIKESFERTFDFPIRLYWNRKMERKNSSCAKAGTPLVFEEFKKEGELVSYRVRRGKRNFFTTSEEMGRK